MNRRDLLKLASLGVASPFSGRLARAFDIEDPSTFFLVTSQPQQDAARFLAAARLSKRDVNTSATPMAAAPQDVSIHVNGRLYDPKSHPGVPSSIRSFALEMADRVDPGSWLVTIEPVNTAREKAVVFEQDGEIIERIDAGASYRSIEVPGRLGRTVFRLDQGTLSVETASCRHALCRKMGPRASGRIVCAPNRLVAVLPGPASSLYDTLTG